MSHGSDVLAHWHRLLAARDVAGLADLLADDAVFHSPVVHTPQRGKAMTQLYLAGAMQVLAQPGFRYLREVTGESDAMLEFEVEIDGILINGVDIVHWNEAGRIDDFKVMIRPLKAIHLVHQKMRELLQKMKP
jgi:hypothetical protein